MYTCHLSRSVFIFWWIDIVRRDYLLMTRGLNYWMVCPYLFRRCCYTHDYCYDYLVTNNICSVWWMPYFATYLYTGCNKCGKKLSYRSNRCFVLSYPLRQSISWFSYGRKAPWKAVCESHLSGQIHNTKKNYSLKSNKNWNEQLQFIQSILPLRLFRPFFTDGKCGFERCQVSFYWVLGKRPIFHRELLLVVLSLYLFICLFDYNLRTRIQLSAWWRECRLQGSSLWVRQQSCRMFR